MKTEDLSKFERLVIDRIKDSFSQRGASRIPSDENEIVDLVSELDSPDLNELVFALRRIEKGVFGQCVICRHDIRAEVLERNLSARLCSSCQGALQDKSELAR